MYPLGIPARPRAERLYGSERPGFFSFYFICNQSVAEADWPETRFSMALYRKLVLALSLIALAVLGLAGCASDPKESAIPWSRPATWENQVPGMSR